MPMTDASLEPRDPRDNQSVKHIQQELSGIFAELSELFGNPPSFGAIHGFLFASPEPVSQEEIADQLSISAETVHQGLDRLIALEAVTAILPEGEPGPRYAAKHELDHVLSTFLEQQLLPTLKRSADRITSLEGELPNMTPATRDILKARLREVAKWPRLAKTLLPMLRGFIKG